MYSAACRTRIPVWQAYRRLARRHHPDKDPGGRDKFHAIQQAYERLMAGSAGGQGTHPGRIKLLLKARTFTGPPTGQCGSA
jgi:hypothetical protein